MIKVIGTAIKLFGVSKSLAIAGAVLLTFGAAYGVWHHKVKSYRACRERGGR